MIFNEKYNYRIIQKYSFDSKVLEADIFKDIYRKYKIVKYKKNDQICFAEIFFEDSIKSIENVIKVYDAEKIVSNCSGADAQYENLTYYRIDDLYFIEFSNDHLDQSNQNNLVENELKNRELIR